MVCSIESSEASGVLYASMNGEQHLTRHSTASRQGLRECFICYIARNVAEGRTLIEMRGCGKTHAGVPRRLLVGAMHASTFAYVSHLSCKIAEAPGHNLGQPRRIDREPGWRILMIVGNPATQTSHVTSANSIGNVWLLRGIGTPSLTNGLTQG